MEDRSIWYLEEVNLKECFCPANGASDSYNKQPKRVYKKSEFIYFSDDTADKVFFIHEGAVKIAGYTEDGNELIKAVLRPGEIFGELAVFGVSKRTDYAQAVEDTELCILDREDVVKLMRDVDGFQAFLNRLMGQRVIYTQKRLESLLFKDAKTRVAEYVLQQAEKNGRVLADGSLLIRNYLTHQEIANFTGTSRQTVTTVLNQFRDTSLLDFDRKRIMVKDVNGLRREAN
ncbi:Crp/Fnr family transcriptional regulator [Pontibacter sp. G13]|uniref:Crp/Fnr family transcriptional regulator n=1 Tax=Pontibacter sp. G13 TaxID=3074898 RepID=UPI00288ABC3C|nr:Crp/Fnr family transcriptional regulator [Pontibacter sp. G13]WNJ20910.1 Crp/Fnr family transcriptional regulator [Pontibacter sp. G13]